MDLSTEHCQTTQQLVDENRQLRLRLAELEATIAAGPPLSALSPVAGYAETPAFHTVDQRFRLCLDHMLDCFAILSSLRDSSGQIADFRYDYINRAGAQANRRPAEDHLGRTLLEVLPGERARSMLDIYRRVVETGAPAEFETAGDHDRDGRSMPVQRFFEVRAWRLGDGLAISWRDITARRQAEEDLRRLTQHARCSLWRAIVTGLPGWDSPQALEAAGQFMRWDGKVFDLDAARTVIDLRQEPGERYEDIWCRDRLPEDHLRMARTALLALQRGDSTYEQEFRCIDRHGRIQWLYESVTVVPLERGRWQAFGVVINISAQKATEEAQRQSERRYRQLFDRSPDGIFAVDKAGRFIFANRACEQICGYPVAELLQKTFMDLLAPDCRDQTVAGFQSVLARPQYAQFETALIRKDGQRVELWVTGEPVLAEGQDMAVHCTARDITLRKHQTEELERAKAAAEAANRAKDHFIAMLSHELRTPLTPAVATLSVLEGDARLPQDVQEDLTMVRRNLDLEVRLIADLLDISRVISGKLHLDRRPTDVAAAIRDAARIVSGDLRAKGQTLSIETPGAPYFAVADSARLQQVFWNLLRNAIKFTPARGTIAIRAALAWPADTGEGDAAGVGAGELVITVTDTGRGISPQLLPRLFHAFEQAQDARSLGGLGLGLAICKAVVEMHGGSIAASSDGPGRGAIFTLRLPVIPSPANRNQAGASPQAARTPHAPPLPSVTAPATSPAPTPADALRPLRILLVEDNHDTALALQRLLRSRGHVVRVAGSMAAALQAAAAEMPELLISDIGLPDGTGLDLMRQIRAATPGLPAIALSGYGQEHDLRQSREAGFTMHLTKPVDPARLYEAIATALLPAATGQ